MRSDVCKLTKGSRDLDAILRESEKVAAYCELSRKQSLHLRLICEELDGMLPELLGDFEGKLWIELEDGLCKVSVSLAIEEVSTGRRKELLGIAKNKKNAAATGIKGKIRSAVESLFLNEELADAFAASAMTMDLSVGYYGESDYSRCWTLNGYRSAVKKAPRGEAWDELEKSVIASVADDVIVGIKGKQAEIIVVKKFA